SAGDKLLREGLAIERVLGSNHPTTAITRYNLLAWPRSRVSATKRSRYCAILLRMASDHPPYGTWKRKQSSTQCPAMRRFAGILNDLRSRYRDPQNER